MAIAGLGWGRALRESHGARELVSGNTAVDRTMYGVVGEEVPGARWYPTNTSKRGRGGVYISNVR